MKPSKKVSGADNQQERLEIAHWVVGFTDGEGCFSIAVIKNATTKLGKQIFPEFVVTQGAKSKSTLEEIKKFFQCGNVFINRRYDNHHEPLYRYCVRSVRDLHTKIVPFFQKFPLRTYKRNDFIVFEKVVGMMARKEHLTPKGWRRAVKYAGSMNRKKKRF